MGFWGFGSISPVPISPSPHLPISPCPHLPTSHSPLPTPYTPHPTPYTPLKKLRRSIARIDGRGFGLG
ncbi:MAG: hypothetical protein O9350_14305 [Microcystis sp. LE19-388.1G]|nr:hypothetical protein [Microcystis sp. LE19-388.1G]